MSVNPLKTIRASFVGAIGPKATHALEAGFVLFFLLGCVQYYPQIASLFAALYGIEKVLKKIKSGELKTKSLFKILKAIVPKTHLNHIRIQPIYFLAGMVLGSVVPYVGAVIQGKALGPF